MRETIACFTFEHFYLSPDSPQKNVQKLIGPLETAKISLEALKLSVPRMESETCHGVVVSGELNQKYFGSSNSDLHFPTTILTVENISIPFLSLE